MILSDCSLRRRLSEGHLEITPLNHDQIQPGSVDFHIGDSFSVLVNRGEAIQFDSPVEYSTVKQSQYLLHPKSFVLATTLEYFKLPDFLTAFVEGRSSVGRLGLFIQNAGWVDPGFEGEITLELFNASDVPILLKSGDRVGQLVFAQLDMSAHKPYQGKYQGQRGATGSRICEDYEMSLKGVSCLLGNDLDL